MVFLREEQAGIRRLTFFPTPVEGETLYSICARYHQLSGNDRSKHSSLLMLGHEDGGRRPDLVTGLAHLSAASSGLINPTIELLRERTVTRSYLPFFSLPKRHQILHRLKNSKKVVNRAHAGLLWLPGLSEHELRCCQYCMLDDEKNYGFRFWHNEHQLPGVWVCTKHDCWLHQHRRSGTRNASWAMLENDKIFIPTSLPGSNVLPLLRSIANAASWLARHTSLNVDALKSMARLRLREQSAIGSELKCTSQEFERLHQRFGYLLLRTGIRHFESFRNSLWIRATLFDNRSAHPLRWCVMLAISGPTDCKSLSESYFEALVRLHQPTLFSTSIVPRHRKAPAQLYDALTGPVSIDAASQHAKLRPDETRRWLRKDTALAKHWKSSIYAVKHRAAIQTIQGVMLARPHVNRTQLLSAARWAYKWLETNDAAALDRLAPERYGKRTQIDLWVTR